MERLRLWFSPDRKVSLLERRAADAEARLDQARVTIEQMERSARGLHAAVGLLEQRNDQNYKNGVVTIACLLSAAGGRVKMSHDLIRATDGALFRIDVKEDADGLVLTLVPEEGPDGPCGEDCCGDPHCPCAQEGNA